MVGGGIVGLATARLAAREVLGTEVLVVEKEPAIGQHQTSHNSGVVHAGLCYSPGSLKARLCRRGVGLLRTYCAEKKTDYQVLWVRKRTLPGGDLLDGDRRGAAAAARAALALRGGSD